MPTYKLTYFDVRGLGEPIRWIFAYAGVPYEDVRIPMVGIYKLAPEHKQELGLDWGQLPTLDVDDKKFAQSLAITRYLARKYNLVGKDEFEELKCDEIVDAMVDFRALWKPVFMEPDASKRSEMSKHVAAIEAPAHLERLNKVVDRNRGNGVWSVGAQFTWADIYIVHFLQHFPLCFGVNFELSKNYPALQALVDNVQAIPAIQDWLAKRPKTHW